MIDFKVLGGFCNRQTNGQMNGQTDKRTLVVVELLS